LNAEFAVGRCPAPVYSGGRQPGSTHHRLWQWLKTENLSAAFCVDPENATGMMHARNYVPGFLGYSGWSKGQLETKRSTTPGSRRRSR